MMTNIEIDLRVKELETEWRILQDEKKAIRDERHLYRLQQIRDKYSKQKMQEMSR